MITPDDVTFDLAWHSEPMSQSIKESVHVRFEVLRAAVLKAATFWNMPPYSSCMSPRFGGTSSASGRVSCLADFQPWRWRWHVPPKCWLLYGLRDVMSHKMATLKMCIYFTAQIRYEKLVLTLQYFRRQLEGLTFKLMSRRKFRIGILRDGVNESTVIKETSVIGMWKLLI
jgi:hypothetical protein